MDAHLIDEAVIREYLLGRLDDNAELVETIDEQSLTNPQFSETIDVIEDEIIEEYLDATLNATDTQAVEKHFLRPPQRQRKLRSARLLKRHLSSALGNSEAAPASDVQRFPKPLPASPWFTPYRTFAEVAAALLLTAATVSVISLHRNYQTVVRESGQQLDQERQRTAALRDQLAAALKLAHPPTAMLSLLQPGIRRGEAQMPELTVGVGTKNIHVEIALPSAPPGLYSVQLESAGKELWSQDKLEPFATRDGGLLIFDFPARVLTPGECEVVVRRGIGIEASYRILVSTLK